MKKSMSFKPDVPGIKAIHIAGSNDEGKEWLRNMPNGDEIMRICFDRSRRTGTTATHFRITGAICAITIAGFMRPSMRPKGKKKEDCGWHVIVLEFDNHNEMAAFKSEDVEMMMETLFGKQSGDPLEVDMKEAQP